MTLVEKGAEYLRSRPGVRTVFIQVPDAKSLIPGCRHQNQTATRREAQISHDILVAGKIQKQEPYGERRSQRERWLPVCQSRLHPSASWGLVASLAPDQNRHISLQNLVPETTYLSAPPKS